MPTPFLLRAPLFSNSFYHVIFKSTDGIILFPEHDDYVTFQGYIIKYLAPVTDIWAFSLLKNHVHIIIKIKTCREIENYLLKKETQPLTKTMKHFLKDISSEASLQKLISRQINSLLVAYAMIFNKRYNRRGGIFQTPFKRLVIPNEDYLKRAIVYVHINPVKHKITNSCETYGHSSYKIIMSQLDNKVQSSSVISFFDGIDSYVKAHAETEVHYLTYDE